MVLGRLLPSEPAPPAFAGEPPALIEEERASTLSQLTFAWLTPLLAAGYTRPLQKEDLWTLPDKKRAKSAAAQFAFEYERVRHRSQLKRDTAAAKRRKNSDTESNDVPSETVDAGREPSPWDLLRALYVVNMARFWAGGLMKLIADATSISAPLLTAKFIQYLSDAYLAARVPDAVAPPLHYGIGIAIATASVQFASTIIGTQSTRILVNTSIISSSSLNANLFRKSLRLSPRARVEHSKGEVTNLFSEDAGHVAHVLDTFHTFWVAPIQFGIGLGWLVHLLGTSGLVGVGVVLASFPVQAIIMIFMIQKITKSMKVADSRVKLMQEVLSGIRALKVYAWEKFWFHRVTTVRHEEVGLIQSFALRLSWIIALTTVLPVASATIAFVHYSLTGHTLSPAIVFGSLQIFNMIRQPLLSIPSAASELMRVRVSLVRLSKFLNAEENPEPFEVDDAADFGISIDGGSFQWEEQPKKTGDTAAPADKLDNESAKSSSEQAVTPEETASPATAIVDDVPPQPVLVDVSDVTTATTQSDAASTATLRPATPSSAASRPFSLTNINMKVPRGSFIAVVGTVASGKTSLLEAIVGEMRKTAGSVILGGGLAYAPQRPWIQNATIKANILFGNDVDETRYKDCVSACALEPDLETLVNGEDTEVGEKGQNLSGGQKARISLARVAYSTADVVLLDDPLSAVDAHVGKHLISRCLLSGPLSGRTRILATHSLHVLPFVDYIYVLNGGSIAEEGSYKELRNSGGAFGRLVAEHGTTFTALEQDADTDAPDADELKQEPKEAAKAASGSPQALMQEEDRDTGAVPWSTYTSFFAFSGSRLWLPFLMFLVLLSRATQLGAQMFLAYWSSYRFPGWKNEDYIAVYATLGAALALITSTTAFTFTVVGLRASKRLFADALDHVVRSPVSFFDTIPMGRIVSRLTKDVKQLDMGIGWQLSSVFTIAAAVMTTLGLVFYQFPPVAIVVLPLSTIYWTAFAFYRRNSTEIRRVESILRSSTFNSYVETLDGLSTVKATRREAYFIDRTDAAIDNVNRATYISATMSQWLEFRLSGVGSLIGMGIALYAVYQRKETNPADTAVVITYALSITAVLSSVVSSLAAVEQDMASVQRLQAYAALPTEGEGLTLHAAPSSWPDRGSLEFRNVDMTYRPGLPKVLQGVSFTVKPGEKVGVCGRTGAGKSSIIQALFRTFEYQKGSIIIDGQDTSLLELHSLRSQLAIIPQESVFIGTIRESIDPLQTRTDAELLEILRLAHLDGDNAKFDLDASVGADGSGLSAGEKQQLALCRVLVKNSKIVVLDEATSSVDVDTDAKLQQTIASQLVSSTLLVIAHRLNTIIAFDRILVMDKGKVAEYDSPLALFDAKGIFYELCSEASIGRDDIEKLRQRVVAHDQDATLVEL